MPVALTSGSHKRNRRVEVGVVLAVVALVAGGSVGVLVAIMLTLFVLDAIIPVPAAPTAQADERFRRLVRLRRPAARRRRARGLAPERLDVLDDRIGWASVAERRELGVLPIPIASITGTVEADKARAFDRELRPDRASRQHWCGLWLAHACGTALPPVSVHRVEGAHFLRDGHHRASVARDQGSRRSTPTSSSSAALAGRKRGRRSVDYRQGVDTVRRQVTERPSIGGERLVLPGPAQGVECRRLP